jgi:tmRNA-binding protein
MKSITKIIRLILNIIYLKTYSWYNFEGSEVKSIRASRVSIVEGYCYVNNNELFIKGMHIAEYKEGGKHYNHLPLEIKNY